MGQVALIGSDYISGNNLNFRTVVEINPDDYLETIDDYHVGGLPVVSDGDEVGVVGAEELGGEGLVGDEVVELVGGEAGGVQVVYDFWVRAGVLLMVLNQY